MRRILCLHLPEWPVQRVLAGRREFRIQNAEFRKSENPSAFGLRPSAFCISPPVVLHARDARRGELVVACNEAARQLGVRQQLPLAEAAALLTAPIIEPHDLAADLAALARLAEHCERFSPLVGWQTADGARASSKLQVPSSKSGDGNAATWNLELGAWNYPSPDCLFLDITGIGVLFGGEEKLAAELVADLERLGYTGQAAIADTIGAAWAGARLSSKLGHPRNGSIQGSKVAEPAAATLNFELGTWNPLRLPEEILDILSQLGIARLDQLLALPRESLRSRFGQRLLLRIDQLLGTAAETIVPHRAPQRFAEEWLFDYPAERREVVEHAARELVQRIAAALAERREGVVRLVCRLDCAPGRRLLLEVGLFRPSADFEHLWDLVRMQFEQTELPGPVGRLGVEATLTAPLENRQGELFAGGRQEAERQLALLIDRCTSRLGSDTVLRPELTAEALPERAVRPAKLRIRNSEFRKKQNHSAFCVLNSELSPLRRPLWLYSPPRPLAVVAVAPAGAPQSFELAGRRQEVVYQWGPERIETGWWRGKSVRRDYWRVQTATGQRFWLFRQLQDGRWYLHGEYG